MAGSSLLAVPFLLPFVAVDQQPAPRPPVVVVEGDFVGADGGGLRAESRKYFAAVTSALTTACVPYETSKDSTVEKWGLPANCRVALFPYNRAISTPELANIRAFLDRGGAVVVFYVGPDELLMAAGARPGEVVSADESGRFTRISPRAGTLAALPDTITQSSWNVRRCEPMPNAVVVAGWADSQGNDTGLPAVVLGDKGAFISHVFTAGDTYCKGQFLRSIVCHFEPSLWPSVIRAELAELDAVGRFGTLAKLSGYLESRRQAGHRVDIPLAAAQRAIALRDAAQAQLAAGEHVAAIEAATTARTSAMQAFWATYPSKPGEMRGAWIIYRGRPTWDDTIRNLAQANFNAVMPRVASAGIAYYPSEYLPESAYSRQHGDQLAQACEAGRKYGVPVHARMLALFVYESTDAIKEQYRKAGRLQVNTSGKANAEWLCPTNPQNRRAVIGCCLEMASKYPVSGIQLDYIRYPWRDHCYCSTCRAKFEGDLGLKVDRWPHDCYEGKYRGRFADWRREQVTSLVREIRLRLKDLNPSLWFSADVFVNWEGHRVSFGQDWKTWVDEGLCDFVCPMDYFGKDEEFIKWVTRQREWTRWDVPMCVGLGPRVENAILDPQHLLTQIQLSRKLGGDGFVLFDYDETLAAEHLPVVGGGPGAAPSNFTVGPPYLRCQSTPIDGGARLQYTLDTVRRFAGPAVPDTGPALTTSEVVVRSAGLSLYTADAWPVFDLGPIDPDTALTRDLTLAAGSYRLCAQGTLDRVGGAANEQFVRWGPLVPVN